MDKQFWLNKWEAKEIGFHLSEYHPLLQKYCPQFFSEQASVFVPLCGKSKDMAFLESQGLNVIGSELSEIAVKEFFADASFEKKSISITTQENHISYSAHNTEILVGDVFDLTAKQLNECCYIYDRAALIALPEDIRKKYVEHLKRILPTAKMLLITLDYDQNKMAGPPFSVNKNELERLFDFAILTELHRTNIIDKEPKFKEKGLTSFNQTAYLIEW